jgi:predicted RNase H-like HicB family nuclease
MKKSSHLSDKPYARIIIPDEDGVFNAEMLEMPGCYAQGETVSEAYENLEDTAKSWIDAAQSSGQEIPEPSCHIGFSGKVALRLPRGLHKQAARFAEREGTSLNQFLVMAIAARVGAEDLYSKMINRLESRTTVFVSNTNLLVTIGTNGLIHPQKYLPSQSEGEASTNRVMVLK